MGYLNMFIVIGFNDTEVKLENTEGNEIETVSWDEVARRLLNNIEIDGLSFNEKVNGETSTHTLGSQQQITLTTGNSINNSKKKSAL